MTHFQHFDANPDGRDFAVGDIHGHFARLQRVLDVAGFDPGRDRLFSVGDLVDRGPDSELALEWLERSWFFAIQGNHEALAIAHAHGEPLDYPMYLRAGGEWFLDLPGERQALFAERFARLPLAIQIDTVQGPVGLVHADCPLPTWRAFCAALQGPASGLEKLQEHCQWSRSRLRNEDASVIPDLRALIVGHTPVPEVRRLGNVLHIDTAGWRDDGCGYFTVMGLEGLGEGEV